MSKAWECKVVLLINLGGPDSINAVGPFLYNLFSDPDIMGYNRFILKPLARLISRRRTGVVSEYYRLIGGKSPILELTMQQGIALEKALSSHGNYRVFIAMRYWHPLIEETVRSIVTIEPREIILFPLYPHYSITTTGSSLNEFERVWRRFGSRSVKITKVEEWYDHPAYIGAMCNSIERTLLSFNLSIKNTHIVFSAHGIPLKFIERGDPYAEQIEKSVTLIEERLGGEGNYHLSYQSRVGPLKWLGPSTEEVLKKLGEEKVRDVVLVPISFISDHLETLYEMDILYREKSCELGITNFYRVPALNDHPMLIEAMKDIVLRL